MTKDRSRLTEKVGAGELRIELHKKGAGDGKVRAGELRTE